MKTTLPTCLLLAACAAETRAPGETCFNGAQCCPPGSVARGGTSALECAPSGDEMQDCFIDRATYRSGVKACPDGSYVRGLNRDAHTLVCCFDRRRGYSALRDDESLELGASTCAQGRVLAGLDGEGALLCRSPDRDALPAPSQVAVEAPLDGETPGSDAPRGFPGPAQHALWKKINRNWLARVFGIPVRTWLALNAGEDPRVDVETGPTVFSCHAPIDASRPCTRVPQCAPGECRVPQQRVTYLSPLDGRRIAADVFFPPVNLAAPAPAERPVVLVTHGHAIDGVTGKRATGAEPASKYRAAARELAAVDQVIAIAPDTRTFGDSALSLTGSAFGGTESHADAADHNPYGTLPPAYALENIYNLSIALHASYGGYRADRGRVFVAGLSMGGWQAIWAGALDPRIRGVIAGGSFLQVWQTNQSCDSQFLFCSSPHGASDRCQIVPGLSADSSGDYTSRILLDVADLAALAAPARYLVTWGNRDENFGETYQTAATRGAQAVYASLGISERFTEVRFTGEHEWNSSAADAFVASP